MSKDKACISAVEEVCQRCHLYKENCGMLDCPDQCSESGRYIDGYHQAEKDTIEKAAKWLKNNLEGVVGGSIYIEDFLKAIKDE